MWWVSKRKLKKKINELENEQSVLRKILENVPEHNNYLVTTYANKYPFELGQVVYDLQLRSATGRYTKTKPSREHSIINEVVVDKKNYFKLVERYEAQDVFKTLADAEKYLDEVCVD